MSEKYNHYACHLNYIYIYMCVCVYNKVIVYLFLMVNVGAHCEILIISCQLVRRSHCDQLTCCCFSIPFVDHSVSDREFFTIFVDHSVSAREFVTVFADHIVSAREFITVFTDHNVSARKFITVFSPTVCRLDNSSLFCCSQCVG